MISSFLPDGVHLAEPLMWRALGIDGKSYGQTIRMLPPTSTT